MVKKTAIYYDKNDVVHRGTYNDGVIGIPCKTGDDHIVEASCFYGRYPDGKPKRILVVSSQAGCAMKCHHCILGTQWFYRNLTANEMIDQIKILYYEVCMLGLDLGQNPYKITIANTGEPLLNPDIIEAIDIMSGVDCRSFKVSTVFPDARITMPLLESLAELSGRFSKPIQLQISLISTSEEDRRKIAGSRVADFAMICKGAEIWRKHNPNGRKINLSLIITSEMECDPKKIISIFPPELFRFRFREYIPTENGGENGLQEVSVERLAEIKAAFAEYGYEITDYASPSPIERLYRLAPNVFRQEHLDKKKK